jgi:deoxyribonuclease IV
MDESDFNLTDLLEALQERKCSGRILCESPVMEEDALLNQTTWEELGILIKLNVA